MFFSFIHEAAVAVVVTSRSLECNSIWSRKHEKKQSRVVRRRKKMSSNSYNNQQSTASRPDEYPIHKISFHFAFSLQGDAVLILKLFQKKKLSYHCEKPSRSWKSSVNCRYLIKDFFQSLLWFNFKFYKFSKMRFYSHPLPLQWSFTSTHQFLLILSYFPHHALHHSMRYSQATARDDHKSQLEFQFGLCRAPKSISYRFALSDEFFYFYFNSLSVRLFVILKISRILLRCALWVVNKT